MTQQNRLLATALAGLAVGVAAGQAQAQTMPKKGEPSVQCFGVNSCKGQNACSVGTDQIKAASEAFGVQYAKSKTLSCAGSSACAGKAGNLAWVSKAKADDCFKEGGFMFEKQKDNKLVIKNKTGIVKKG